MPKYKLSHNRPDCIGCSACASIAPDFWEMDDEAGKSDLKDSERDSEGKESKDIDEKDFVINKEAAESCPVNVIHLKNKETDEEII